MSTVAPESAVQSLRPSAYHDRPTAGAGHGAGSGAFAMLLDSSAPPSDPPARGEPSKALGARDRRDDAAPARDRPDSATDPEPAKRAPDGTDDASRTDTKSAQTAVADEPSTPTQSDSVQPDSPAAAEVDEVALAALVDAANADAGAGEEKADKDKTSDAADADADAIAPAAPALVQATPKPGDAFALAAAVPGAPADGANASSDQAAEAAIAPVTAQSGQVGPVDQQPEGKVEGRHTEPGALKSATIEGKPLQGAADQANGPLTSRPVAEAGNAPEQTEAHGEAKPKFADALAAERSSEKPGASRSEVSAGNQDATKPHAAPPPGLEPTPAIANPAPTMWRAGVAHSVPTSEHTVPVAGLAVEIAARAHEGLKRFDIRLDPPELGRIEVRLDVDNNGQVTSRLTVDRPATLDLLRSDAHALERALQSAGLNTDGGLQFSLRDQSFGGQDPGTGGRAPQLVVADDEMARSDSAAAGYAKLAALRGGVDIRV